VNKGKKIHKKKLFFRPGDLRPFLSKNVQIWDHFFALLFPKDSKSLKTLDIRLWEVEARKSVAPSSGDFRRRPAPRYVCGQDQEF
jgi:hypothetical protein